MKPLRFMSINWDRVANEGAHHCCIVFVTGWACLAGGAPGIAADWSQYRGIQTDGVSPEMIRAGWPGGTPICLWRVPTSAGLSSFVEGEGKVFTVVTRSIDSGAAEIDGQRAMGHADGHGQIPGRS
jgi:hypothetical protein